MEGRQIRERLFELLGKQAKAEEEREAYPKAIRVWQRVLDVSPKDPLALSEKDRLIQLARTRAKTFLLQAKDSARANDLIAAGIAVQEALKRDPSFEKALTYERETTLQIQEAVRWHLSEASKASASQRTQEAMNHVDMVLRLHPAHPDALRIKQEILQAAEDRKTRLWKQAQALEADLKPLEALDALEAHIKLAPSHDEALGLKTLIQKRLAEAKGNITEVKRLVMEGDIAYGQGHLKQAIDLYEQALPLDYYDIANLSIRWKIDDTRKELK